MICSLCSGLVIWKGPITALTHTECQKCGGINCQNNGDEADAVPPFLLHRRWGMADVTGPISSLPGSRHASPEGMHVPIEEV